MVNAPMNPLAGPSGPGDKSTRTDQLKIGSAFYADDTAAINTAAPKSKTRGSADDVGGRPASPATQTPITPLFAPSQRPEELANAGTDVGGGPGSSALMMQSQFANNKVSDSLAELLPYDSTGEISILYQQAIARGM
jgi:hypothetical protein